MCGKYFQGRGPSTCAYTHSVEQFHHIYMNLDNGKVYCLPDGCASPKKPSLCHRHTFTHFLSASLLSPRSLAAASIVTRHLRSLESAYARPVSRYEVEDRSLDDIRFVLRPTFTVETVKALDLNKQWSRGLDGTDYLPGVIGLNNLKNTDYVNAVIQAR